MIYSGINERARGLRGRERVVASNTASLRGSVRGGDASPRLGEKGSTEQEQKEKRREEKVEERREMRRDESNKAEKKIIKLT